MHLVSCGLCFFFSDGIPRIRRRVFVALSVTLVSRNGPCLSGCHADMELELIKKCFWLKRSKGLIVADDGVCGTYAAPVKVEMSKRTDNMWTTCRFTCRRGDVSEGQKTKRVLQKTR